MLLCVAGTLNLVAEVENDAGFDLAALDLGDRLVDFVEAPCLAHDLGAAVGVELEGLLRSTRVPTTEPTT